MQRPREEDDPVQQNVAVFDVSQLVQKDHAQFALVEFLNKSVRQQQARFTQTEQRRCHPLRRDDESYFASNAHARFAFFQQRSQARIVERRPRPDPTREFPVLPQDNKQNDDQT